MSSNNPSDRPRPNRLSTDTVVRTVERINHVDEAVDEIRQNQRAAAEVETAPIERTRVRRPSFGNASWGKKINKAVEGPIRQCLYEFLGTGLLLFTGINAGFYITNIFYIACIWGSMVALAILITEESSQGHINPAFTLTFAIFRGFPWKKVPFYVLSQFLAGIVAAGLTLAFEGKAFTDKTAELMAQGLDPAQIARELAGLMVLNPNMSETLVWRLILGEFIACSFSALLVCIVTDKTKNYHRALRAPSLGLGVFFDVVISMNFGLALNPARDFGPRLVAAMYFGRDAAWNTYMFIPLFVPILANCIVFITYDIFLTAWREPSSDSAADGAAGDGEESEGSEDIEAQTGETLPSRTTGQRRPRKNAANQQRENERLAYQIVQLQEQLARAERQLRRSGLNPSANSFEYEMQNLPPQADRN